MKLGVLYNTDRMAGPDLVAYAQRLDRLGYESLWVPELFGREPLALAGWLLAATDHITVGTGIINVYARDAVATAAGASTLAEMSGGRFHLGLGVSNKPLNEMRGHDNWIAPAAKTRQYVEAVRDARLTIAEAHYPITVAAHGPRLIDAAADVADGVSTYLMTRGHTARTRDAVEARAPSTELTAMTMVLRCDEPSRARELARKAVGFYIGLPHYLEAWRADGYDESDVANGGSDRLIDDLVSWGTVDQIRDRLSARFEAGADRVVIIPLNAAGGLQPDWDLLEALAS